MTNKPGRTSQKTNKLRDELILGWTGSGDKGCMYHCANRMLCSGYKYFQLKQNKEFP